MREGRWILMGLDGVPYRLLKDLAERSVMPNTKSLIEKGILRPMSSSIPEVSSTAWSSAITGRNPGEHGIFGFTDIRPGTYEICFPNYNDLKGAAFWERPGWGPSVIMNVPSTYPSRPMNGVHIAGFVALELEKSVYPASLIAKLKEFDYRLDVDSSLAHQSMELFLKDLEKTLKAQTTAYRYLWEHIPWQTFMLVVTTTDRLMHFLWSAYEDPRHPHHEDFLNHFREVDALIGEIEERLNPHDFMLIMSDHGFERLEREIYVNHGLAQEGFLKFENNARPQFGQIDFSTKAFALDPGRIYINKVGRYPRGSVSPAEEVKLLEDMEQFFRSLEMEGRKVIRDVYRKEEIYRGLLRDRAPDLILVGAQGFDLKASLSSPPPEGKNIFTGKHTQHDAFVLTENIPESTIPSQPTVFDIVPMMEKVCGESPHPVYRRQACPLPNGERAKYNSVKYF